MGRGLSELQKHILRIAADSPDSWAYDLQALGLPTEREHQAYLKPELRFGISDESIQAEIRKCCDDARPVFKEHVHENEESASKRASLARSLAALERLGLIKRWKALGSLDRLGFDKLLETAELTGVRSDEAFVMGL